MGSECLTIAMAAWLAVHAASDAAVAERHYALKLQGLKGFFAPRVSRIRANGNGQVLQIVLTDLIDEQLESIDFGVFATLEAVSVSATRVTNRGLKGFERLRPGLMSMAISHAQVDDQGVLRILRRQRTLKFLSLRSIRITDRVLREIGRLPDLMTLCLDETRVTDAGLDSLEGLEGLTALFLSETAVSDAGLTSIAKIQGLVALDLSKTRVTDKGLLKLGGLPRLETLRLKGTRVTEKGKAALRLAIPNLIIE